MEIRPFSAFRYNASIVGDVGACIAPPYDVIDDELRRRLYRQNDYNVVRIIKGQTFPDDNDRDNQYTRAGQYIDLWIAQKALVQDGRESIYVYVQDFEVGRERYRRSGFIALGKLEQFGRSVQPHEKTLDGPKADRLKLMHAKAAQFGQIFMLYDDPEKTEDAIISKAAARTALVDFTDDSGTRHRLYAIDDPQDIRQLADMMKSRQAVIADGHHRYETALAYYEQTQNPAASYRMMTFVNMRNPGLVILATHRLVSGLEGFSIDGLIERLRGAFEVAVFDFSDEQGSSGARDAMFAAMKQGLDRRRNVFGLYAGSGAFHVLTLKDASAMGAFASQLSAPSRALDVNVLHKLILERNLGIGEEQLAGQTNLTYVKDAGDAVEQSIAKVDRGDSQAVFFMNPTRIEQIRSVVATGEKMPQKSTFFYPKIYTGLVVNKL